MYNEITEEYDYDELQLKPEESPYDEIPQTWEEQYEVEELKIERKTKTVTGVRRSFKVFIKEKLKSGEIEDVCDWFIKTGFIEHYVRGLAKRFNLSNEADDIAQDIWVLVLDEKKRDKYRELFLDGEQIALAVYTRQMIFYELVRRAEKKKNRKEMTVEGGPIIFNRENSFDDYE